MFPTHVGMNRGRLADARHANNVPHTRGDEPKNRPMVVEADFMFPTHVGMNRIQPVTAAHHVECSPHTWG